MINSKQKGKRGELLWKSKLQQHGFIEARRGQQYSGGTDSPDVVCPELPGLHFEVKYTEKLNIHKAMDQAIFDANQKIPIVAHKINGKDFMITMNADDWLNIIKETSLVNKRFCPACKGTHIHKDGPSKKMGARYECQNPECNKRWTVNE